MMPCRVWVEFWCQVYPSSNIHPANLCKALVFTFRPWHLLQKPRFYQNRSKSSAKYAQDSEAHFARELSGLTASTAVETSPPPPPVMALWYSFPTILRISYSSICLGRSGTEPSFLYTRIARRLLEWIGRTSWIAGTTHFMSWDVGACKPLNRAEDQRRPHENSPLQVNRNLSEMLCELPHIRGSLF